MTRLCTPEVEFPRYVSWHHSLAASELRKGLPGFAYCIRTTHCIISEVRKALPWVSQASDRRTDVLLSLYCSRKLLLEHPSDAFASMNAFAWSNHSFVKIAKCCSQCLYYSVPIVSVPAPSRSCSELPVWCRSAEARSTFRQDPASRLSDAGMPLNHTDSD